MTVLLYAVTEAGAAATGAGLDAQPLRTITDGDLAAVVSDHEDAPAPTESNLWAYEHVIERLMTSSTVVPARFGAAAAGDDDVRAMLDARRDELSSALTRLDGTVEFAVHTTSAPSSSARSLARSKGSTTGMDYMRMRLKEQHRARAIKERVDAAVGDIVLASTALPHAPERLAYLVNHDDVEAFVGRLIAVDDPSVSWTGPWPPYSFTRPGEAR